jgi:hypothetical protein
MTFNFTLKGIFLGASPSCLLLQSPLNRVRFDSWYQPQALRNRDRERTHDARFTVIPKCQKSAQSTSGGLPICLPL